STAWSTVVTATSHQTRANGLDLQVAGSPTYSIPANPPIIIGGSGPSGFGFSGRIKHLLIFATALDAPDRILLERFLDTSLVTNADDHGPGSLRQTLAEASPFSVVRFDPAIFNGEPGDVIHLESGITIAQAVTIDASDISEGVTIDGGSNGDAIVDPGETRCFFISDGQADELQTVAFRHLTIRNGVSSDFFQAGANIHNRENLTLEDCTVANGRAVVFSAKGGGIYSESGSLTLKNSTITGNQVIGDAASGGGIYSVLGELTISGCTVSDNQALGDRADGGGIYHEAEIAGPVATLTNSTLHGNASIGRGGGYYNYEGDTQFVHCTLAGNTAAAGEGGGIASYGDESTQTELTATIVRNAASSDVDVVAESEVSVTSAGANLIGTGNAIGAFAPGAGDRIDASTPVLLAPLGNYGGPTAVMPPLAGSPAIDAVATLTIGTDQLGHVRPHGLLPDIGAVEAIPISTLDLADVDGDGIPDILEGPGGPYPHLTVGTDDSGIDTDGDGSVDGEEIATMTDPFNPSDKLRIVSFLPAPGFVSASNPVFNVTVSTFPGLKYQLGRTEDLDAPFEPQGVSPITATAYETTFTITLNAANDFVRAELVK
ncbi:MAG: choice-of-anchor Q domain-containing protein, partial [Chthoniobacteraceae bacterium]